MKFWTSKNRLLLCLVSSLSAGFLLLCYEGEKISILQNVVRASNEIDSENLAGSIHLNNSIAQIPIFEVENDKIDFGNINQGSSSSKTIKFKNAGNGHLRILSLRTHCGCTVARVLVEGHQYKLGSNIAPGLTGLMEFTIDGSVAPGEKTTSVDILTNDSQLNVENKDVYGLKKIRLRASIEKYFFFDNGENSFELGDVSSSYGAKHSLVLTSINNKPFTPGSFHINKSDNVVFNAEPIDEKKSSWKVSVTIPAGLPHGQFIREVKLDLESQEPTAPKELTFAMTCRIRGSLALEPSNGIHFYVIKQGQKVEKKLMLKCASDSTIRISNVLINQKKRVNGKPNTNNNSELSATGALVEQNTMNQASEFLSVSVEQDIKSSHQAIITIRAAETAPKGAFTRFLTFDTGIKDGPQLLEIPITGVVN